MARDTTNIGMSVPNQAVLTASEAIGVTAAAGGGQANATLITDGCNKITTVAAPNDSVKLTNSFQGEGNLNGYTGGMTVYMTNQSANSCQVFGSGIDTINAAATGTGVALAAGKNAVFFCTRSANPVTGTAGEWYMVLSA